MAATLGGILEISFIESEIYTQYLTCEVCFCIGPMSFKYHVHCWNYCMTLTKILKAEEEKGLHCECNRSSLDNCRKK